MRVQSRVREHGMAMRTLHALTRVNRLMIKEPGMVGTMGQELETVKEVTVTLMR